MGSPRNSFSSEDCVNELREVQFQQGTVSEGCVLEGVVESGERKKGKRYSKDRWIELPPFPRGLMTIVEPEQIPSSSREVSARGMNVLAQEIRKESRYTSGLGSAREEVHPDALSI